MSKLTENMTRHVFLEVCMGIESLCAELYHYYSKIYEDIPEASRLWKKAALEEENHQKQFGLALRLMNETEFEVIADSLNRAHSVQYKLIEFIERCKTSKPDLMTAVATAVVMEEQLANLHAYNSLNFKEESMQNLFKALSDADRGHVSELQHYMDILYLQQSEING